MLTFVARRLLMSIPVLLAASFIIFIFVSLSGDPLAELRMNPRVSEITLSNIIERNHLDESVIVRYGYWLGDIVRGDLGTTLLGGDPIWPDLSRALGNTVQLILLAEIVAVTLAILVGIFSAVKQYSPFDYAATAVSFVGFSTPVFWFALILQILVTNIYLNTGFRLFYTAGLNSPEYTNFWIDRLQHLALPVIVLSFAYLASYSRYIRGSMLEVVNADYVRTARAKGLSERRVVYRHAFRNALIPLVTVVALDFGALFGGAVVTESVFSLDGMGQFFLSALFESDTNAVLAFLMVTAVLIVLFNLLADIAYGWLDPRIRYD
ncbi:MAG: ABC transporter permease [Actinomycetota bacterium]|nr:ABC transporter permease [Actinomycetota bacterium]